MVPIDSRRVALSRKVLERWAGWLTVALVVVHIAAVALYLYLGDRAMIRERAIPEEHRRFRVAAGASLTDVLAELEQRALAPSAPRVRLALAWRKLEIVVKKGTYLLPERASTLAVLEQLDSGRVMLYRVTLPEGLDKWQTAALLGSTRWGDEATFLALIEDPQPILAHDPDADDLEGYLFPETYAFGEEATPREIVDTMVSELLARTESQRALLVDRGLSLREWVTLASLVEKETAVPEERARIAGVFANRLERGMLLQCDPTIIYSLKREGRYRGKIYRSDIRHESPYNTYVSRGLPPGPIASPGADALSAALFPEGTPYLYFVAKNDGSHHFSRTLREHNRAVRRYQR